MKVRDMWTDLLQVMGSLGVAVPLRDTPPGDAICRPEHLHPGQLAFQLCYWTNVSSHTNAMLSPCVF